MTEVVGQPSAEPQPARPTRERIIEGALELFAEQGYEATTVGQIERTAGLAPRSGALYKHFASKRAVIDAAISERLADIDAIGERLELQPLGDLRAELTLIARITLAELERERNLSRIVMKDGDRFPELADAFSEAIVRRGHLAAEEWVRQRAAELPEPIADPEALAQVMTDALVGYALQGHFLGERAVGVGSERVVEAWTRLALSHLDPEEELR